MSAMDDPKDDRKPATGPGELGDTSKSGPDDTDGEEPESGGGYGNHAPDMPSANEAE